MPFPAEPPAVCAYVTGCADQGLSWPPSTRPARRSATQHRSRGVPDPIDRDAVRQVRRGLRRIVGRAPVRPAHPLSVADVRQIVAAIGRCTVRGARDTALILLGFGGALRRSELAGLTLADLEAKPGGVLLAGDRISGHSLRAGHATSAALAGVTVGPRRCELTSRASRTTRCLCVLMWDSQAPGEGRSHIKGPLARHLTRVSLPLVGVQEASGS